jgi:hypothetical protein
VSDTRHTPVPTEEVPEAPPGTLAEALSLTEVPADRAIPEAPPKGRSVFAEVDPTPEDAPRAVMGLNLAPAPGAAAPPPPAPTETLAPGVLVPLEERPVPAPGEAVHECPGCGASWVSLPLKRNSASSFCPTCDFPLFLAVAPPEPAPGNDDALRRLPGVDGREHLGALKCWSCGEPNLPDPDARCIRCRSWLTPPPPPPEPEIIVVHEPEIHVVTEVDKRWMWVSAALAALLVLTIALFALFA